MGRLSDRTTTIAEITAELTQFVRERDWEQYHHPKDLAIGLAIEAAELLEHFRFRSNEEIAGRLKDPEFLEEVGHELADALYFVLLICSNLGLDAAETLRKKLALSARRYPAESARGRNVKYTELQRELQGEEESQE